MRVDPLVIYYGFSGNNKKYQLGSEKCHVDS